MWQTSGAPHQLHIAPAARQPASGPLKKKDGVPGRIKVSLVPQDADSTRPSGRRRSMTCIDSLPQDCNTTQIFSVAPLHVIFGSVWTILEQNSLLQAGPSYTCTGTVSLCQASCYRSVITVNAEGRQLLLTLKISLSLENQSQYCICSKATKPLHT